MYSTIMTAIVEGIHTIPVTVEVDISDGMPIFDMVGYLSAEVREARNRVRTALHNCGIVLPAKRITVNLSPGNVRKSGTGFDLPIAVALLASLGLVDESLCKDKIMIGELNLSGQILPVNGVLPIVADGWTNGYREFIVPFCNLKEARLVKETKSYGFQNLKEVIHYLNDGEYLEPDLHDDRETVVRNTLDFADVNGQQYLKRACEVAASGMHNMLMIGPPGAGKTMISERMATILPPLTEEEKMELSKIYSVCGLLSKQNSLITERPFRSPHHTTTMIGLTGGGSNLHPGEISLAHHGVLFLDELAEFQKSTLEILRQPLEERQIHIVRSSGAVTYPASFLLLTALNPCACGYYPDMQRCRCTQAGLKRYYERISQPLLDRIDICVEASALSYHEITGKQENESSESIRKRVVACHEIQHLRFQNEEFKYNSQIPASRLQDYCRLDMKEQRYMEDIYTRMELTGRTYHKILRVARTIADLDKQQQIKMKHLNEAICYRSVNEKYWGGFR